MKKRIEFVYLSGLCETHALEETPKTYRVARVSDRGQRVHDFELVRVIEVDQSEWSETVRFRYEEVP